MSLGIFNVPQKSAICPSLHIEAPSGSSVTVTNGVYTYTKTSVDGYASCDVPNYGLWTVSTPDYAKNIDVNAVKVYEVKQYEESYDALPVAKGGTGISSVTSGNYIVGNGTGALQEKTPDEVLENIGGCKLKKIISHLPSAENWKSVCYGDSKFVAVGHDGNISYSLDTVTWISCTIPGDKYEQAWNDVCYGNDKFVAVSNSSDKVAYSEDGIIWQTIKLPSGQDLTSVSFGVGKFVAIDQYCKVLYSTDGINWISKNLGQDLGIYTNFYSICFGEDKFVALGIGDVAVYSVDGVSWRTINLPSIALGTDHVTSWNCACSGGGKFVALSPSEVMIYSNDGISWSSEQLPSGSWHGLCYGNDKFVAVGANGKCMYSFDGINWIEAYLPCTANFQSVCYGGGKFVAISSDSEVVVYSMDGINWEIYSYYQLENSSDTLMLSRFVTEEKLSEHIENTTNPHNVTADQVNAYEKSDVYTKAETDTRITGVLLPKGTCAFADLPALSDATTGDMWNVSDEFTTTADFAEGTGVTVSAGSNIYKTDGGKWDVLAGSPVTGIKGNAENAYRTGNVNITPEDIGAASANHTHSADELLGSGFCQISNVPLHMKTTYMQWKDIAYGNGKFVAIGYNNENRNYIEYSNNGVEWFSSNLPTSPQDGYWTSVAYGSGKFIAVGYDGNTSLAAYSLDGIEWIPATLPISGQLTSVSYAGGKFIVIRSGSPEIAYSVDGINWTYKDNAFPDSGYWGPVSYGNGKFVAVGSYANSSYNYKKLSAYSTDGITWVSTTLPTDADWKCVSFGNGVFVAIGSDYVEDQYGRVIVCAYSTDGENWVTSTMPSGGKWSKIVFGNANFVAISANSAKLAYSSDGITWNVVQLSSMYDGSFGAIAYGKDRFIVIDEYGEVLLSKDGVNWTNSQYAITDGTHTIPLI